MSSRPELKLDWCSYAAAKYAVEHWHYSQALPKGKNVYLGVWESGLFVGTVIFGTGAGNATSGKAYGLGFMEMAELVRVALREHSTPVSRIIAIAVRLLVGKCPGLRMLISFADPMQGHHGGIYQAAGWMYCGRSAVSTIVQMPDGRRMHERAFDPGKWTRHGKSKPTNAQRLQTCGKYRYLMPLDAEIRARILPLAQPYPKRAGSIAANAPASLAGEGGAAPTPALV